MRARRSRPSAGQARPFWSDRAGPHQSWRRVTLQRIGSDSTLMPLCLDTSEVPPHLIHNVCSQPVRFGQSRLKPPGHHRGRTGQSPTGSVRDFSRLSRLGRRTDSRASRTSSPRRRSLKSRARDQRLAGFDQEPVNAAATPAWSALRTASSAHHRPCYNHDRSLSGRRRSTLMVTSHRESLLSAS